MRTTVVELGADGDMDGCQRGGNERGSKGWAVSWEARNERVWIVERAGGDAARSQPRRQVGLVADGLQDLLERCEIRQER